ncbi:MAG: energy-coupling factor transport system ATP-binding protein [Chloroflexota bacterium]|jgi:energy-coupling factor transport system ATP-binding protein|nr:energy-coupling factor transport system ATP-binding protein [Chloroflexota bacterium]
MALITLEGVSYRYPAAEPPALVDVSATIEPGQVILLRGPSGSGKSTLLRCLNGLVPHSTGGEFSGRVIACGLDTRTHAPRDLGARIGFVFQHPDAQFVLDDVEAELAFGMENLGLSAPLMRKRVEEVIDQVGINHLRRRRIDTLSGGERQRVAIAAALAVHPQALVLDEPTSQLDPQAAEDVLQVVMRLVAELGMTTVIAEHRVERIAPFVDRIWTLDAGTLKDQSPRTALAEGGARPPVVDLALRAGWTPIPLGLRDARVHAQRLPKPPPYRQPSPSEGGSGWGPAICEIENLEFRYNGVPAVRGLTLSLRRGQITALMGRNGSGKTTLLRVVAGLLRPQRGTVHADARAAYVPQDADALLFSATVEDELRGQPPEVAAPFQRWLHRYPRDLSSGERQQLAIAVVAGEADVLLLDEPTRGLDPLVKQALSTFLRMRAAAGAAIVIATHDVEWAARTADRILLMADGEIYADGPPGAVLSDSLVFATQISKLVGGGWLLAEQVPL